MFGLSESEQKKKTPADQIRLLASTSRTSASNMSGWESSWVQMMCHHPGLLWYLNEPNLHENPQLLRLERLFSACSVKKRSTCTRTSSFDAPAHTHTHARRSINPHPCNRMFLGTYFISLILLLCRFSITNHVTKGFCHICSVCSRICRSIGSL